MTQPPREPAAHVERALCVLAHPDDVDFGSAGTVATWTAAGTEVTYCIVTDGDAGGFDETPREQVSRAQERILRSGVSILGVLINALEPEPGHYYRPYAYEYGPEKSAPTIGTRRPRTSTWPRFPSRVSRPSAYPAGTTAILRGRFVR